MSRTRGTGSIFDGSSPARVAQPIVEEDTARAVIKAYTAAVNGADGMRLRAFDAALRAYRRRQPHVSEAIARRQVAEVLCFAATRSAV